MNITYVAADTPFNPTPDPPYDSLKWGFNNDTIMAWRYTYFFNSIYCS